MKFHPFALLVFFALFALGVALGVAGCEVVSPAKSVDVKQGSPHYNEKLSIVKVGECQYVLWHNDYGSDMEHYGACEHCTGKAP